MALSELKTTLNNVVGEYNDALTEAIKSPGFSITLGDQVLTQLDERIMSLSLTDNRGFDADQLTLSVDDIANRLKNDYRKCPDMWQRSIADCYQNNVA